MPKTIVLSLGGSLIFPDDIDAGFLKKFKKAIEKYVRKGYRFVIYCGGGKLARRMQNAALKIDKFTSTDLDWIGIYATMLNAEFMRKLFRKNAESFIIQNPNIKVKLKKGVAIASGWIPGWSTDYDAVLVAKNLGIKEIINMSNVDYVYDKDPKKHRNAKRIE